MWLSISHLSFVNFFCKNHFPRWRRGIKRYQEKERFQNILHEFLLLATSTKINSNQNWNEKNRFNGRNHFNESQCIFFKSLVKLISKNVRILNEIYRNTYDTMKQSSFFYEFNNGQNIYYCYIKELQANHELMLFPIRNMTMHTYHHYLALKHVIPGLETCYWYDGSMNSFPHKTGANSC